MSNADGQVWMESEAEFGVHGDHLYFPAAGSMTLYAIDPISKERVVSNVRRITTESVELARPLSSKDFQINYPKGTAIFDHVVGIGYIAGATSAAGTVSNERLDEILQQVKLEMPIPSAVPESGSQASRTAADVSSLPLGMTSGSSDSTSHQAYSGTTVILIAVAALFIVVAAIWVARRKRNADI